MWSRHSERTVLTNRSAKALALGARMGVRMTRTSSVRNTSSNGPENFASRSCRRNLIAEPLLDGEVPSLLRDPRRVGMRRRAHHVHSPCRDLDEEQDIERLQTERLHGEETAGQDARGLRAEELGPRRA